MSKDNFVIQTPFPVSCINPSTPRPAGPLQPLSGRSFEPVHMVCRFRIPEIVVHPLASKNLANKTNTERTLLNTFSSSFFYRPQSLPGPK